MSWNHILIFIGFLVIIWILIKLVDSINETLGHRLQPIGERLEEIHKQLLCIRFDIPFVTEEDKKYIDDIDAITTKYDSETESSWNERIDKNELYGEDWKAEILETLNDVKNLLEEIRKDSIALNDISDELGEIKGSLKK